MKDAKIPKERNTETIKNKIDEKINSIYSSASDKFEPAYKIKDIVFLKTYNGKYALQYTVTVELKSKDQKVLDSSETVSFLVYL